MLKYYAIEILVKVLLPVVNDKGRMIRIPDYFKLNFEME